MRKPTPRTPSRASSARRNLGCYALVLDVGTTGVKAFVFDRALRPVAKAYRRLHKSAPKRGWVEQRPAELVAACRSVLHDVVAEAGVRPGDCLGLGLTNQRETTVLWDRASGQPVYPAIVWEDRRTRGWCAEVRRRSGPEVAGLTGLTVDSYFSASKARWILDHVPAARRLLAAGRLAFGTVDTWLLFNLCSGRPHLTDETNAARTLLFDIRARRWSPRLLGIFGVPEGIMPEVRPSRSFFGVMDQSVLGVSVPVLAVCGDQQSSMYAALVQSGGRLGATKATFGTGTFVMQSLGPRFARREPFFTTLIPGPAGRPLYALEAKIEGSAAAVEKLLDDQAALKRYLEKLARKVGAELERLPRRPARLVIDGGITRDGLMAQALEKITGLKVTPLQTFDGTALGTAELVFGIQAGPSVVIQ